MARRAFLHPSPPADRHALRGKAWPANSIEKTAVAKIDAWLSDMTLALHRHAAVYHQYRDE